MTIPAPFNLTELGNATGFVGLMQGVNTTLMHGWFGVGILVAVYIITLLSFLQATGSGGKAVTSSSFIVFMLSILLRAMDLVPDLAVYASLALTAFCVAFLIPRD